MPMNVLAVLVFKVRCAPIHQHFTSGPSESKLRAGSWLLSGGSSFEEVRWDRTRQIPNNRAA
jgi:hypothetical protein